jgi:hypothetical protein
MPKAFAPPTIACMPRYRWPEEKVGDITNSPKEDMEIIHVRLMVVDRLVKEWRNEG